jgi:hypothetical protein
MKEKATPTKAGGQLIHKEMQEFGYQQFFLEDYCKVVSCGSRCGYCGFRPKIEWLCSIGCRRSGRRAEQRLLSSHLQDPERPTVKSSSLSQPTNASGMRLELIDSFVSSERTLNCAKRLVC